MDLSKHAAVTRTQNIHMFDDKSWWRWRYHTRQEAILLVYKYKLWWPDFGISFTSQLVFKMNHDFIEITYDLSALVKYQSCNCKRFLVGFICSNRIFRNIYSYKQTSPNSFYNCSKDDCNHVFADS
jgi:hypothetical protein